MTGGILFLAIKIVSPTNKTAVDWAKLAQKTIYEMSQNFDAATTALSNFDAKKFSRLVKLATNTAKIAGALGVFSAIFSIALAFIPKGDSPELKYMKTEFGKLSRKMDKISRSLDETKDLIKLETQKAAYLQYEHKIHYGVSKMEECLKKLDNVKCLNETDCKRKKQLIAQGYVKAMQVDQSIDAIARGVSSNTAFGTAMLSLLKQNSKCNIPKLNLFTNKITAMITKGFSVTIFRNILTRTDHNVLDDTVRANEMLRMVESKRQKTEQSCFRNMGYWMSLDVRNSEDIFLSDIQATNTKLLGRLKLKYPWVNWHVFTYKGEKAPVVGPQNSPFRRFLSTSKKLKVHSFVMPAINTEVENLDGKIQGWKLIAKDIKETGDLQKQIPFIEKKIKEDAALEDKVLCFAILPGTRWIFGKYSKEIRQHWLGVIEVSNDTMFVNRPDQNNQFPSP